MVQRCVNKVTEIAWAKFVKAEMFKSAIKANGVYDTFDFCEGRTRNDNTQLLHLDYMQVTDEDITNISDYCLKVIYFTDADCFGDAKHIGEPYYVGEQYYDATVNKIKEDLVKDKNAIWSTISINEVGLGDERRFEIRYKRVVSTDDAKKPSEIYIESENCGTSDVVIHDQSKADKPTVPVKHTESEICDISSVIMRDGTTYKISDLVTYDKDYLYFPVEFGIANFSRIVRIKIPLKTLKEALDQVE